MSGEQNRLAHPGPRLLAVARARALEQAGTTAIDLARVRVLGPAADSGDTVTPIPANPAAERMLVLSWIGAHRDARVPLLARLWDLEEAARAAGPPVIVLRFAPVVGPGSPLVAQLARQPRLNARLAHSLIQPLHEDDAVAALARLLSGALEWRGWYEVCGSDAWTVAELAEHTAAGAFGRSAAEPAWEPAPGVLSAQGMAEWEPWARASGVTPRRLATGAEASA